MTSDQQPRTSWRLLRVFYFATICLPPPLMIFLYPAVFLRYLKIPSDFLRYYAIYFWLGLLILLIDLWFSNRKANMKILWTVLVVVLGVITLPIYWFRFVLRNS